LNKTKNSSQNKLLRRVLNPRYHSNYGKNFRHLPGSIKPFAFTQQYGRSLLSFRLSVLRLRSDGSLESSAIASHHPATLSRFCNPTVFVIVVLCDIQIYSILYSWIFEMSIVFLIFYLKCKLHFFRWRDTVALHPDCLATESLRFSVPAYAPEN